MTRNSNLPSASIDSQTRLNPDLQTLRHRVLDYCQPADDSPSVQGDMMKPQLIPQILLLGLEIAFRQQLASKIVIPTELRDFARNALALAGAERNFIATCNLNL